MASASLSFGRIHAKMEQNMLWSRLLNGDYLSYITVNEMFFWFGKNKEHEDATLRSD